MDTTPTIETGNGTPKKVFTLTPAKSAEQIEIEAKWDIAPKIRHSVLAKRLPAAVKMLFCAVLDFSFLHMYGGNGRGKIFISIHTLSDLLRHDRKSIAKWRDRLMEERLIWFRDRWPDPEWRIVAMCPPPDEFKPREDAYARGKAATYHADEDPGDEPRETGGDLPLVSVGARRGGDEVDYHGNFDAMSNPAPEMGENVPRSGGSSPPKWGKVAPEVGESSPRSGGQNPPSWGKVSPSSGEVLPQYGGDSPLVRGNPSPTDGDTMDHTRETPLGERVEKESSDPGTRVVPAPKRKAGIPGKATAGGAKGMAGPHKAGEEEFLEMCLKVLGKPEMDRNGGLWRIRYRENAEKATRCVQDVRARLVENPKVARKSPAAMATDNWRKFQ
ncbi:MAG: hypothetical protein MUE94_03675 [Verrucomicrobia bacterium]|jgi:hypothetical protein|nr:hypothetical protein [Verrucomicrobiota bacterium]